MENKQKIKGACIVSAFTVLLYLGLSHFDILHRGFSVFMGLVSPFITAVAVAFILDGLVRLFERKVYRRLAFFSKPKRAVLLRSVSILSTFLLVALALALLTLFITPQISASLQRLSENIPIYFNTLNPYVEQLLEVLRLNPDVWNQLQNWFLNGVKTLMDFAPSQLLAMLPKVYGAVASFGGGVFNFVMGVMLSIYLLLGKEKLLCQLRRLNRAFVPAPYGDLLQEVASTSVRTFGKYITGQLIDALIIGTVSIICLSFFTPYGVLIGTIMGVTNIIPFFGPFIGAIPGVLILFLENPMSAVWYILFVVVLQQLDGNVIAPRVVGGSVGLPAIWAIFSVILFGGLFGIPGMVLGTPVFAIFYTLLGRATRAREKRLSITPPEAPADAEEAPPEDPA